MAEGRDRLARLLAERTPSGSSESDRPKKKAATKRPGRTVVPGWSEVEHGLEGAGNRVPTSGGPSLLLEGDLRSVLRGAPGAWADCLITDPGVGSTSNHDGWRHQVPAETYWSACLRAAKPGAHMAVFAGRKTFHRLMVYAEDAGWEVRDTVMWAFAKGMPMSLDIGQAVDKKMGGDGAKYFRTIGSLTDEQRQEWLASRPSNPWYGWGTELRPSWEPIVIFRKPLEASSIAQNVLDFGAGAINIDATRIDSGKRDAIATHIPEGQGDAHGLALKKYQAAVGVTTLGRWPANALFSHAYDCSQEGCVEECPVGILDRQDPKRREPASRYFFCPKASTAEKNIGGLNEHDAVKPVAVSDWLMALLCPPGGVVLDPFAGTCSTGLSAVRLDAARFVGIDTERAWLEVGASRLAAAHDLGR